MIDVRIALPDDVAVAVDARVRNGGYVDLADYVRALIEMDVEQEGDVIPSAEVLAALAAGERSGRSSRTPREVLEELLQRPL